MNLATNTSNTVETKDRVTGGRLHIPRSRGAASGLLLVVLGLWGAVAPFLGPQIGFAYDDSQAWTAARGWLEVLPGALTVVGGVLLLTTRNRVTALLGGWLAVAAGAWFIVGRAAAGPLGLGSISAPTAGSDTQRLWLELAYFHGLGALIVFLAAVALGRLSVRTVRDVDYAQRARVETIETADTTHLDRPDPEIAPDDTGRPRRSGRRWFSGLRGRRTTTDAVHSH